MKKTDKEVLEKKDEKVEEKVDKKKEEKKKSSDSYWKPSNPSYEAGKSKVEEPKEEKKKENNKTQFGMNNNGKKMPKSKKSKFGMIIFLMIVILFVFSLFTNRATATEVPYSTFKALVLNGNVYTANIKDSTEIVFTASDGYEYKTRIPYYDDNLMSTLESKNVEVEGSAMEVSFLSILIEFLPWIVLIGFYVFIIRNSMGGGQLMQFGKSHAKQFSDKDIKVKFKDVAGQKEAKYELEEVVDFLKHPAAFNEIGAKMPRGVLLVGPPGTGKTLLAKAVAGEAGVSFFHTSGSDFVEMFVGMGAARVRDLFEQGRKQSPCIIFIDEIDAVGRSRGSGLGGGHDEREQTLNQILVEMDGFDTTSGVIVIAATNRADVLDPALLRPGRFDRQVTITLPDIQEREDILKIHAAKVKMDKGVDLFKIARATPGASGADLANLVNEAALYATRNKRKKVTLEDFEEARDKMVLGVAKKSHVMTPEDKKLTAYHEAGHALLFYHLPDMDPLYKVTIIPHGDAGGLTMGLPEKDDNYLKKTQLTSYVTMSMGGYVAEELVSGQTTTGPSADIKQATNIARRMVTEWGMSNLGFIALGSEDEPLFLGREITQHKDFSDDTAKKIDAEIKSILDSCMKNAKKILTENKDQLDAIANALIEKETLSDNEVRALLGLEIIEHKNSDLN